MDHPRPRPQLGACLLQTGRASIVLMNERLNQPPPVPQITPPARPKWWQVGVGILAVAALILGLTSLRPAQAPGPDNNAQPETSQSPKAEPPADPIQGLTLKLTNPTETVDSNEAVALTFSINKDSAPLLNFDVSRERVLHLYIIRKDLRYFYQVHPRFDTRSGQFSKTFTFPTPGKWRLIASVKPTGLGEAILSADLTVQGPYTPRPLTAETTHRQVFDGTLFDLIFTPNSPVARAQTALDFALMNPASEAIYQDLDRFLGGRGDTIILKEGTLDFVPASVVEAGQSDGRIRFEAVFPMAGRYRIFSQFQRQGKILTSFFTVDVN